MGIYATAMYMRLCVLVWCAAVTAAARIVDNSLVAWYRFDEGIDDPTTDTIVDRSSSPHSPGNLVFNRSFVDWRPGGSGVTVRTRASGNPPKVALQSTGTLDAFTQHLIARQIGSDVDPEWMMEIWIKLPSPLPNSAGNLVTFSNFTSTLDSNDANLLWDAFTQAGLVTVSDGVHKAYNRLAFSSPYSLDANTMNAAAQNVYMMTLRVCTRNDTVGSDCYRTLPPPDYPLITYYATRTYICVEVRGPSDYVLDSCDWGRTTPNNFTRPLNYTMWLSQMKLQVAPGNTASATVPWAGDIYQFALYNRSLTPAERAATYAAGLPRGRPTAPAALLATCVQDTPLRSIFPLNGTNTFGGDVHFQLLTLPAVGTLYAYDGLNLTAIASVPSFLPLANNVSYVQSPFNALGDNFANFTYRVYDGFMYSLTNTTVTINVVAGNHAPLARNGTSVAFADVQVALRVQV